jgi:threonine dehydratase
MLLSPETMRQARDFLAQFFGPTRLLGSESMAENGIYFKLETDLPTGSFKVRGAMYALWSYMHSYKVREVVASSTGNHGAALAYAARHLGVPATIFLPANPNPVKAERIQRLGATLVESGIDSAAAARAARQHAQHTGAYFLDDASDANVPAGTATIAMEILDQLPEVNEICVPVGDTALIRGIATAVR